MPNWTYGNVRLYVQEMKTEDEQLIARLNPLGGGTVTQVFGYDELIVNIDAYIVGLVDEALLRSYVTSGISFDFFTPYGINGYPYLLKNVNTTLTKSICQTLRTDLDEDSPVYVVNLELWRDW